MKVSIIIPVYNVEPYIESCLESVLNQTYHNLEIIVIDDCGQDNSIAVARAVVEKHPNRHKVRFLKHEENRGLSVARNTGIAAATGDYIYFLDSDDEITPDCIETLVKESEGFEIVVGTMATPDGKLYFKNRSNVFYTNSEIKKAYLEDLIYNMAWNKLIDRELLVKNRLFFEPGLLHEDRLWTFFVMLKCQKLKIIEKITYLHRKRAGSIIANFSMENINHYLKIYSIIESFIFDRKMNGKEFCIYLMKLEYLIKNVSVYKVDMSFCDFKKLQFSKHRYPFLMRNIKNFCKGLLMRLPVALQYILLKCYAKIKRRRL